ncbi:MAG: uracil-DNA glycosylase [Ruminococcaceae bacterium]|nr:uracil-DNA glycosylase [Oscillospiraceae bacterium]
MVNLGNSWDGILKEEFEKEYYLKLRQFLKQEYFGGKYRIFPEMNNIFNALRYTDYNDVKVVILGQDPYHGFGQAHGLCFSVQRGVTPPPSLVNIFKELNSDIGVPIPKHGELTSWAKSGVLLLNAVLTVREGMPASHKNAGWEIFTDRIISILNMREKPIVFMLWGSFAKSKAELIDGNKHLILTAAHPSPLSAYNGFFGCKHFSRANHFLKERGMEEIDWEIK